MEITKEILESILDAYSYEIVFVDRQHIVRYMNKTAKERYGGRVKINQSLFNCHSENSKVKIEEFLNEKGFEISVKIPFDKKIVKAVIKKSIPSVEEKEFFEQIGFKRLAEELMK